MPVSPPEAGSGRRAFVAILLLVLFGGWLITQIEVTAAPEQAPVAEPAEPSPVSVTLDPASVPVGTESVRVAALCTEADVSAVAASTAFADTTLLDEPEPGGGAQGEAELARGLRAGTYEVNVHCQGESRFGTATLTVTGGQATPSSPRPQRTATTTVTLAQARPGDWREHPEADLARVNGDHDLTEHVFRLTVTHELRLPDDDPDVAALRAGAAGHSPTAFVEDRVGEVGTDLNSSVLPATFGAPTIEVEAGSGLAVVTFTGSEYGNYDTGDDDFVGVEFSPPSGEDALPFATHAIAITATGWTVAGVHGPPPLSQDRHSLRLAGDRPIRMAFTRDGHTTSVAGYLAGDDELGRRVEAGRETGEPQEELLRADFEFVGRARTASGQLVFLAVVLAITYCLGRALGRRWWRRPRNWLLVAALVAGYFLNYWTPTWIAFGLLTGGLSLLSLFSAARAVPGKGPLAAGALAAAAAGVTLSVWGLVVVSGQTAAAWWLGGAAGLATAAAAVPRWRRALPVVAFLALVSGVLLAGWAARTGVVPGVAVWLVVLSVFAATLAFGWGVEANHGWSPRTGPWWIGAVLVASGLQTYATVPEQWHLGGWVWHGTDDPADDFFLNVYFALALLAAGILVVRVQRIGRTAAALTATTASYTAVLFVMTFRVLLSDISFAQAMALAAWAAVAWLLSGTAPPAQVSEAEHRLLVRDMLRRRSVRAALTDLLRQRQETSLSEFEERRTSLERAADEHTGPVDSDLALSTLAGRTPWQNGLAALAVGSVLSLPFSAVRVVESAELARGDGLQLLVGALTLLSLPMLCMIFGYFYPRVRGATPITKSLALLVTAVFTELPGYVGTLVLSMTEDPNLADTPPPTPNEALIGVLVAVGNIAVVSIGLGLWWEWRLMASAGEPWARVRDVRTLRALAAPLLTVAIAGATTATTVLVNNVVAPLPTVQAPASNAETSSGP